MEPAQEVKWTVAWVGVRALVLRDRVEPEAKARRERISRFSDLPGSDAFRRLSPSCLADGNHGEDVSMAMAIQFLVPVPENAVLSGRDNGKEGERGRVKGRYFQDWIDRQNQTMEEIQTRESTAGGALALLLGHPAATADRKLQTAESLRQKCSADGEGGARWEAMTEITIANSSG
ncbi:hypothetical protein NEUTE2DRAFT_158212 [Neurospora tetrasperma FGSC 2509]|nr:hypothetical protein NEUTE2DRAFT_158212 [Neurospora tetrasperma FGSC 2509]